jgi:hypothetical protein
MSGPAFYVDDIDIRSYLLAIVNSKYVNEILKILNPSFHVKINDIKRIPIIIDRKIDIIQISNININISKTRLGFP